MFHEIAAKAGLVGFALVVGVVGLEACSSGGSGTAASTGGTSASAGTGGTSSLAGTTSAGGASSSAGTSSVAGTSGTGGSATGPFACAGIMANCDSWTTFPQSSTNSWGSGMFIGGITISGTGLTRDATSTDSIHVTGMVTGYGFGFGLYFTKCSDLSKYTGVSFKVRGKTDATNMLAFQLLTNPDTPWQPRPMDKQGACTALDPTMAYNVCGPPTKSSAITTTEATVNVLFTDLAAGMPTATADPKQVLGLRWSLPWATAAVAYAADVTVSDVHLTGGIGTTSCVMGTGGTGAGGTGGAATGGGGAGGSAAGSGGVGGQ